MNNIEPRGRGFTLIEMVLALSIFSLIILMSYQVLATTAQAKLRVSQSSDEQTQLRAAYRTLGNAFAARAQLNGDKSKVELNLSRADSTWLDGTQFISFVILDGQALWAYVDNDEAQASLLLSGLEQAEFKYFVGEQSRAAWALKSPPVAVELSWIERGELRKWLFHSQ